MRVFKDENPAAATSQTTGITLDAAVKAPRAEPLDIIDIREPQDSQPGATGHFDVAVVGLGYVGLPTSLAYLAAGRSVLGLDVSLDRLATISAGRADLLDRDRLRLAAALEDPLHFRMTPDATELASADSIIICVPTPVDDHLVPDLRILRSACAMVVDNARPGQTVILSSTTYVGCTTDLLVHPLAARGLVAGSDLHIAFSPERIDPGNDRHDLEDVPRVVGGATQACTDAACEVMSLYARRIHQVGSTEQAEMVKLVENTFRAVNIALANEFAEICRVLRLPVVDVIDAAATKPYGFMRFNPGPGVGGHCIPCDPHYLLWQLRRSHVRTPVIEQAMVGIAERPGRVVERIRELLSINGRGLTGARVLVCGVTYKPDVEDVRESPALEILRELRDQGAEVAFHDPLVQSVRLPDGTTMTGVADPVAHASEIVLLHSLHSNQRLDWLDPSQLVLDATYQLADHGAQPL